MTFQKNKLISYLNRLIEIYLLGITVWFVFWFLIQDGQWLLTLVNRFVPWLFLPLVVLLPLSLGLRLYRSAVVLCLPLILFVTLFAPYVLPKPAIKTESDLRVMSYNVLLVNEDYDAVAEAILSQKPDLVALQEVQPEMMAELQSRLEDTYPYSELSWEHEFGTTAIFSRYPIDLSFVLDLENDRPAVVVQTEIDQTPITFISAHLNAYGLKWIEPFDRPQVINLRTQAQNRQAEILVNFIENEPGTVILGCDCNSLETSESMRMLADVVKNGAREVGWRPTAAVLEQSEHDHGLGRIDYVLFKGDLQPVGAYKLKNTGGSDHQPVLIHFAFNHSRQSELKAVSE